LYIIFGQKARCIFQILFRQNKGKTAKQMPGGFNQRKVLPQNASVSGALTMHKKNATIFVSQ
jgi:hypothetical protein